RLGIAQPAREQGADPVAGRAVRGGLHHREGSRERGLHAGDQLVGTRASAAERVMTNPDQLRRWQQQDAAHFLHPFTDTRLLGERGTRVITGADGIYLHDADGNQLLDGMAGLWCVAVGYGRKELVDAAARQMSQLPYYNSFFQCSTPPA